MNRLMLLGGSKHLPLAGFLGSIDPPDFALDPMKLERPIDPPPKVAVLDRHHLTVPLPLPVVFPPIDQSAANAARDVPAWRNQRYARWLLECFESSDYSKQFETFSTDFRLAIGDLDFGRPVEGFEHETPIARLAVGIARGRGGIQKEMGCGDTHRATLVATVGGEVM